MSSQPSARYAAVASTAALVVALAGTGYAATALAHNSVGTAQLKRGAVTAAKIKPHTISAKNLGSGALGDTTPIAVIAVDLKGHLVGEAHRVPVTGRPKVKRQIKGSYLVVLPGFHYISSYDAASCNAYSYTLVTTTVDGDGPNLLVHVFGPTGQPANVDFRCSIWRVTSTAK